MLTLSQARAEVRAKSAAEFRAWAAEAQRNRGVSFAAMGTGEAPEALTDAEIDAKARAAVRRRAAYEVSPTGRFLACVINIQKTAVAQSQFGLAEACESARAAASRGLDTNISAAHRTLDEMEVLGADITKARTALIDLSSAEAA